MNNIQNYNSNTSIPTAVTQATTTTATTVSTPSPETRIPLPAPPPPSKAPPAPNANNVAQLTSATQGAPSSPLTTALKAVSQPVKNYVPPPSTPPPQRQPVASTSAHTATTKPPGNQTGMHEEIQKNLTASRITGFGNTPTTREPAKKAEPRKAQPAVIKYPCMGVAYLLMKAGRALSPMLALVGSFVAGSCMIGAAWASMGATTVPDTKEISKATIAINDYYAARGLGVLGGNLMDWATGAEKGTTATREIDAQRRSEERPGEYGAAAGYVGAIVGAFAIGVGNAIGGIGEILNEL